MAVAPPRPRLPLVVPLALLLALVALASGCGGKDAGDVSSGSPTGGAQALGSNPAPATPASAATTAPQPKPKPPTHPGSVRAYAEAVLAAWKQGDVARLADLTTPMVQEQIMEIPGPPNQDWSFRDCEDDATVYCGFFNAVGDWISLRIDKDKLGKAHAASAVEFDATVYPADSFDYVKEFIAGWEFGNIRRMQALARPEVVEYVRHGPAPVNPVYATADGGGAGLHRIEITNPDGFHLILDVGTTLLGSPDAIRGYSP
jgi:hypothetical protein